MEITHEKRGESTVVKIEGQIDAVVAPDLEKKLDQLIGKDQQRLVADLSELDYISSAGLRTFLIIAKKIKSQDGQFILAAVKPDVMKVFQISGFTAILTITDSVETALSLM